MTDRLAVFDLDGTLVDTAPDLSDTTNVVLAAHNMKTVPEEVLRDFIGMGSRAMIRSALRHVGVPEVSIDIDTIDRDYIEHYSSRIARYSRPFPEIVAALELLKAEGVALAVCTNKRESLARQLLAELGMLSDFAALSGGDTFGVSKPDPEHLLKTIALAGGTAARTVYVGDSRIDYETARAATVPIVGLSYGYSDVPIRDLGPDRLCEPGDDIAAAILSLMPN